MIKVSSTAFALLLACLVPALAQARAPEEIDLFPAEKASWTLRNVGAGFSALLGGWDHWYAENELLIETVPADADLALYYLRQNFQKRYERAPAPVKLTLPPRIYSTSKDHLVLRALLDGYLVKEASFRIHELPEVLVIQLEPLPNSLVALGHTYLAGRSSFTLRTTEEPEFRISRPRGANSLVLSLIQTADKLEARPEISDGPIAAVDITQVGEDLMISVELAEADLEARSRSRFDPIREEHVFTLDLSRRGVLPPTPAQIRSELDRLNGRASDRCQAVFETVLRESIDPAIIARAFRASGGMADLYQREAMRKLGRRDKGRVEDLSGDAYRTGSPIELQMALQSAATIRGYLGLLATLASAQDEPEPFLRSLIAPDMASRDFGLIVAKAERAKSSCLR